MVTNFWNNAFVVHLPPWLVRSGAIVKMQLLAAADNQLVNSKRDDLLVIPMLSTLFDCSMLILPNHGDKDKFLEKERVLDRVSYLHFLMSHSRILLLLLDAPIPVPMVM